MPNPNHGIDLPTRAAQLGCRNPIAIKSHPQSLTCRVEGPEGQPAILKIALGRKGKRVLKKEWKVLNQLRLDPPAAVPNILGWRESALLMDEIQVPSYGADEAKEILGTNSIQGKLESLLLQIQKQSILRSGLDRVIAGGDSVFSHGDLSERNLLIDPKADSIHLIDFQEAGWRAAGYDLIHLCSHARQTLDQWGWQKKLFARVWPKIHPDAEAATEAARNIFIQVVHRQLKIDRYLSRTNPNLRSAYEEGVLTREANLKLYNHPNAFNDWYGETIHG